jgi:hypothetical protein
LGASKPATYGRFKTSQGYWGFLINFRRTLPSIQYLE